MIITLTKITTTTIKIAKANPIQISTGKESSFPSGTVIVTVDEVFDGRICF